MVYLPDCKVERLPTTINMSLVTTPEGETFVLVKSGFMSDFIPVSKETFENLKREWMK